MTLAALAATLITALFAQSGESAAGTCHFRNVIRAPGEAPVRAIDSTTQRPSFAGLLAPFLPREKRAWVRVSADGLVTDVCAPEPDGYRERIVDAARRVQYIPARNNGRAVASVGALTYEIEGRYSGRGLQERIGTSTDVGWLARIAVSSDAASDLWHTQPRPLGQPKDLRIAAYTRLGELGTPGSITAQRRVADALRVRPMIASSVSLTRAWTHPGWQMGDYCPVPIAATRARDGGEWVVLPADVLGSWQLFLTHCAPGDRNHCTRPRPIGPWSLRYVKVDASLRELGDGRLQLAIAPKAALKPSIMDGTAPFEPPKVPGPETRTIVFEEIERDSDGDGWTDIEERTLGLDPNRRDSDGDGIDDGRDRAPLYAPTVSDAAHEELQILAEAIFTAFGLNESPWVLLARDAKVRQLQPWGLSGPVLFNRFLGKVNPLSGGPGGVFVTWKIARKSQAEAVVEISDWEGPLAAGGQEIHLRRIANAWVVVGRQTTWIS
jgi:hypothetical protein